MEKKFLKYYYRNVMCFRHAVFDFPIFVEWICIFACGMLLRDRGPRILWKIGLFRVSLYVTVNLWKPVTFCFSPFSFHASSQKAMIDTAYKEMPVLCNVSICPSIRQPSTSSAISYARHRTIT
jgi:hypothetical protein